VLLSGKLCDGRPHVDICGVGLEPIEIPVVKAAKFSEQTEVTFEQIETEDEPTTAAEPTGEDDIELVTSPDTFMVIDETEEMTTLEATEAMKDTSSAGKPNYALALVFALLPFMLLVR